MGNGPSSDILFPENGPYDVTLGYSMLPGMLERLSKKGFEIEAQSRFSPMLLRYARSGVSPIYKEKQQAGLVILDASEQELFTSQYPQLIYHSFEEIPRVIVDTLLLIEDRELLDPDYPFRNPTLDWGRLMRAVMDLVISKVDSDHDVPGGSTLATQIEKYRHSPEGRTSGVKEKWRQMRSATLRAYIDGPDSTEARKRVVTEYINSVPLGAIPGAGEVRGVGHGLVAWHGANFSEVNRLLKDVKTPPRDPEVLKAKAQAYKEVLSLFLAQRRPAYYLQSNREDLKELVSKHLNLLSQSGVITATFRQAVDQAELSFRNNVLVFQPERLNFIERKGANAVRVHLLSLFGFDRLYTLDRLDLKVHSTIDYATQKQVTSLLEDLKKPEFAEKNGLKDQRLLAEGDPAKVVYSFTLRERVGNVNVLRVQADNVDGPFNLNEGGKLELGSTAKLRTLTHYLEIVEKLHQELGRIPKENLSATVFQPQDRLSAWARDWIKAHPDGSPAEMLEAALERTYSAHPGELFFTGGGQHRFSNFAKEDNGRVVSVKEALKKSINLPFVRMMRDISHYHIGRIPGSATILSDPSSPERKSYLTRFANREGRSFLGKFYLKYRGQKGPEIYQALLDKTRLTFRRLAAIDSVVRPEVSFEDFLALAKSRLPSLQVNERLARQTFEEMRSGKVPLHDLGYIATVHPLELWLVSYMFRMPQANFSQIMAASVEQRLDAYQWLFNSKDKRKQDLRIKIMLEQEAFERIHDAWSKLGYPFGSLVSTLATSLGSSGDKPAALADLLGIISSGGIRYTNGRVGRMVFGEKNAIRDESQSQLRSRHEGAFRRHCSFFAGGAAYGRRRGDRYSPQRGI
ncbi:glycosyl transferase family 51 [Planctomyces bekefii]|uniref:peptidoglycan glycosyltransferase n=1 Tax=Planctomyces bekefii TaxID=1653850 RepID=A0A5C6M5R8_9PLAN|nr:glycosyl transferase family 51 [Planctomyces bekefii]